MPALFQSLVRQINRCWQVGRPSPDGVFVKHIAKVLVRSNPVANRVMELGGDDGAFVVVPHKNSQPRFLSQINVFAAGKLKWIVRLTPI